MNHQVRRWSGMFYVVISCSARDCDMRWKSRYYQSREEAERYAEEVSQRPRCLKHTKRRGTHVSSAASNLRTPG